MKAPKEELHRWAADLDQEIVALENEIRPKQERLASLQKKRTAVAFLLNAEDGGSRSSGGIGASAATKDGHVTHTVNGRAPYTTYDLVILESLVEIGGRGSADEVLRRVKEKMEAKGLLGREDYEDVPGGTEERWRNTARWRRMALVNRGFLNAASPRGIWEITEEGRAWLRKQTA
jgi:hypothetical protein